MPARYVYLVFTSIACLHTYLKYPSELGSEFTLNFKSTLHAFANSIQIIFAIQRDGALFA